MCDALSHGSVSRAQKISTVVDISAQSISVCVSRAQKISTVVDIQMKFKVSIVSRAQKISTVVDIWYNWDSITFHALKKFLLL